MKEPQKIFKILTFKQWEDFQKDGIFHGSEMDLKDKFIHLSFANQWEAIWDKFFHKSEVYLVELSKLDPKLLKIEANKIGGTEYPHYYGRYLTMGNVKEVTKILAN